MLRPVRFHQIALIALPPGAGKHAVLGRHPTASLVLEKRRHPVLDRGSDEHVGLSHLEEAKKPSANLEKFLSNVKGRS